MKNHYIQKAFLENFVDDNEIFYYDLQNRKLMNPLKNASKIAYKENLFDLTTKEVSEILNFKFDETKYKDGELIEKLFKNVEDKAMKIIKDIQQAGEFTNPNEELVYLLWYFLLTAKRSYCEKERIESFYGEDERFSNINLKYLYWINMLNEDNYRNEINYFLCNYDFALYKNKDNLFLIGDNYGEILSTNLNEILMPITCNLAILMSKKQKQYAVTYRKVYELNNVDTIKLITQSQISLTKRWIYGAYTPEVIKVYKPLLDSCIFNSIYQTGIKDEI